MKIKLLLCSENHKVEFFVRSNQRFKRKHTINIQLNINGSTITVPADQWAKIKENKLIAAALDQEITEAQAEEITEG